MKRNRFSFFIACILLLSVIVSCAPAVDQVNQSETSEETVSEEVSETETEVETEEEGVITESESASEEKKTLRLLWWQAATILNPHLSMGIKDGDSAAIILEPLATWDSNDVLIPILAEEIPTVENGGINADFTEMVWKLKRDVKWSDGTDFTAEDVLFTYEYIINPEVGSNAASPYLDMEKVEIVDPYTIKVTFKQPTANPYLAFVSGFGYILQKNQFEEFNGSNAVDAPANLAPIGTGPFRVVSFVPGDVGVYEKNPYYRDVDSVYFDEVIIKGGGDSVSAAIAVLQTGEYDLAGMMSIEKDVMESLMSEASTGTFLTYPSSFTLRITLNHTNPDPALGDERSVLGNPHPFLTDWNVRKALEMAVNREVIIEQLWGITGTPTCTVLSHIESMKSLEHPWGSCPYDIEGAKALLDEASWVDSNGDGTRDKDGVELNMVFVAATNAVYQKVQEIVKAGWEELGVSVELKTVDPSIHYSSDPGVTDNVWRFYADAGMVNNGVAAGSAAVIRYMTFWLTSEIPAPDTNWVGRNLERYSNPVFDEMHAEMAAMTNVDEIGAMAMAMSDLLYEDVANIPILLRKNVVAISNDLKGVELATNSAETWSIARWYKDE